MTRGGLPVENTTTALQKKSSATKTGNIFFLALTTELNGVLNGVHHGVLYFSEYLDQEI